MGLMEDLRRQARETESEIEKQLEELRKVRTNIESEAIEFIVDGEKPEQKIFKLVDHRLEQLKKTSDEMKEISSSKVDETFTRQVQSSHLALNKEYRQLKSNLETKRYQQELMGNRTADSTDKSYTDLLLKESRGLDSSLSLSRTIIEQAREVTSSLQWQKLRLEGTADKVVRFAESLPGINVLLSKISRRKRFNSIVIALAVTICLCLYIIVLA